MKLLQSQQRVSWFTATSSSIRVKIALISVKYNTASLSKVSKPAPGRKPSVDYKFLFNYLHLSRSYAIGPVIYSLTETETETEIEIISLTETKTETEMFRKTETKYKRKSERTIGTKRNINWNENDFKTIMVTYIGKKFSASIWFFMMQSPDWPVPAWTSGRGNSARRRCHHLLEQTAGSLSTACPTGPRHGSCASIPSLRGMRVLRVRMAYSWPQKQTV